MNVQFSKLRNISATANTSINLIVILIINHLYRLTKAELQPQNVAARLLIYAPAPSAPLVPSLNVATPHLPCYLL